MQIRVQTFKDKNGQLRQSKTVSLLRYAYDSEKKRSKQVVLGTVDRWAHGLPPELESILTDAEREEFREWAAERDRQLVEHNQKYHLLHAAKQIGWAAKALAAGVEPIWPGQIWDAMDVLAKALEKADYPKPTRAHGRPPKGETPTPDYVVACLFDDPMVAAEQVEMDERRAALPCFIPYGQPRMRKRRNVQK